jgi:hypothetical protein
MILINEIALFELTANSYTYADVKAIYRRLASKYHPDRAGGCTHKMQLINNALEQFAKYFALHATLVIDSQSEANHTDLSLLDTLVKLAGVIVEVAGYWIWVSGNTFEHKEILKNLGFKFSKTKKSWYWSPTISEKKSKIRGKFNSMNAIRANYSTTRYESDQYRIN